jgi:hypothetical protein
LLRRLEKDREDLIREAQEVLASGPAVDGRLVARELEWALPQDPEPSRLQERLMEKF